MNAFVSHNFLGLFGGAILATREQPAPVKPAPICENNWFDRRERLFNEIHAIEVYPPRHARAYSITRRAEELRGDVRAAYRDRSEVLMRAAENAVAKFAVDGV